MLIHTPANGSPSFWRTSSISPSLADSGLSREKSCVLAPVGSRMAICMALRSAMGSLKRLTVDGGGGYVLIRLGAAGVTGGGRIGVVVE